MSLNKSRHHSSVIEEKYIGGKRVGGNKAGSVVERDQEK